VRAVGYQQAALQLSLDSLGAVEASGTVETRPLEIRLADENFRLEEVHIQQGEDPAYTIIRQAIKNRHKHLNEIPPHTAEVYIKGVQRLLRAPEKFMGIKISEIGSELGLDSNR